MDTELHALLIEVEAYLVATGMGHSKFGKLVFNDGAVVRRMREGNPLTSTRMSAMRQFMVNNPPPAHQEAEDTAA